MWNKATSYILLLCVAFLAGCSDDDSVSVEQPSAQGTFVDARDGKEYHYIHVGGLDWSVENLAYDLGNQDLARVYQSEEAHDKGIYSLDYLDKYGMLYTYDGAVQAVPDGWRLPTDADWAALEASHGYLNEAFSLLYAWAPGHTSGQPPAMTPRQVSTISHARSSTVLSIWNA